MWEAYDLEVATILEKNRMKERVNLRNTKCRFPYTIDYKRMVQIRNETGYEREIQRVSLSVVHTGTYTKVHGSLTGTTNSNVAGVTSSTGARNTSRSVIVTTQPTVTTRPTTSSVATSASTSSALQFMLQSLQSATSASSIQAPSTGLFTAFNPSSTFGATSSIPSGAPVFGGTSFGATSSVPFGSSMTQGFMPTSAASNVLNLNDILQTTSGQSQTALSGQVSNISSDLLLATPAKKLKSPDTAQQVLKSISKTVHNPPASEDCSICMSGLTEESAFETSGNVVFELNKCKHMFHQDCLEQLYKSGTKDASLKCPTCKTIYGTMTGDCPPGTMSYTSIPHVLPGHEDCTAIKISYDIRSGTYIYLILCVSN